MTRMIEALCPPGHVTTSEYGRLHQLTWSEVSRKIQFGKLPYTKVGPYRFIPVGAELIEPDTAGMITLDEFCKREAISLATAYRHIGSKRLPAQRINGRFWVQASIKMEKRKSRQNNLTFEQVDFK